MNVKKSPFLGTDEVIQLKVYEVLGREVFQLDLLETDQVISTSNWANGLYKLVLFNKELSSYATKNLLVKH